MTHYTLRVLRVYNWQAYNKPQQVKPEGEKRVWRIGRTPDCIASHAYVTVSSPADPAWTHQRYTLVFRY